MSWEAFADSWHEFYLMAGTAAVTLAGLLFVAISLHVEALVHESREHLLALARATLMSFTFVLVLALMMLVPHSGHRVVGTSILMLGGVFLLVTLRQLRRAPVDHADFSTALFRRRLLLPLLGYALVGASGVLVLRGSADGLYLLVGATCMLLGNAAGTSWDLLVRVARIRRRAAEDTPSAGRGPQTP